ncbi:MAG TPA: septal ring lytic transglycosylase RlpA family protein [Terriglobia bacterium]|nr:septal ring lytic transglycosylase RlpA family protein [Terriglobia bacterium]
MKSLILIALMAVMPLPALYGRQRKAPHHSTHTIAKVQYGVASWYGARCQGRLTASGKPFNEHALTAAHRTLPLGTKVKVTNLRNGRSVVLKIIDRGPAIKGRVIDVSRAASRRLGFTHRGLTPVKIRVVSTPEVSQVSNLPRRSDPEG